jgi:hypothetical protein
MPAQKRMTIKDKVSLAGAIIVGTAAIIAAVIGIFPDLLKLGNHATPTAMPNAATAMAISFNRYDDPYGMFSIEYPSDYVVTSRNQTADTLAMLFRSTSLPDKDVLWRIESLDIKITRKATPWDQGSIAQYDASVIEDALQAQPNQTNYHILSNQNIQNGFIMHTQFSGVNLQTPTGTYTLVADFYRLFLQEGNASVVVSYMLDDHWRNQRQAAINNTFSTFSWSSSNVAHYLSTALPPSSPAP